MKTPESRVKQLGRHLLAECGAFRFSPVGYGMGNNSSLDDLCCYKGRFVAVEYKAAGGVMTHRQMRTKALIETAGGVVLVITEDNVRDIPRYLAQLDDLPDR